MVADYGFSSPFVEPRRRGVDRQRIFGAGGAYVRALGVSLSTCALRLLDRTRLGLNNAEVSTTYNLSPRLLLGLAYIYTWGAYKPSETRPKWHQINIGADYFLSKRTDLYVTGIYQRAAGDAQFAQIYTLLPHRAGARSRRGWACGTGSERAGFRSGRACDSRQFPCRTGLGLVNHIDAREYNI